MEPFIKNTYNLKIKINARTRPKLVNNKTNQTLHPTKHYKTKHHLKQNMTKQNHKTPSQVATATRMVGGGREKRREKRRKHE